MPSKKQRLNLAAQIWKTELGAFLKICESLATPRSQACYMMAVNECWADYLALNMPDVESPTFRDDYLVSEAMRKNPRLPNLAIDRKAVAKSKWLEAEDACRATNIKLRSYLDGRESFPPEIDQVLTKARGWIADVLGELNTSSLELAESLFRFGPGATSSCSGRDVVLSRKMVSRFDVTPGLYPYWRSLVRGPWAAQVHEVSLRHYSTIQFVPKDAKTDRPIGIEPHGNIFVQLGLGGLLRSRLKRHGLNLDTQADVNRLLASRAQKEGLATIDLSSASDTIAHELVWLLLPPKWAYLLDLARTGWSKCDGKMYKLEKFSAMGNGYTFELESLIFTALARGCGDLDAVSFGDDIITSQSCTPLLMPTLKLFGFKVNERKTFLAGRFFESCGADYHDGLNVRPFYFRGEFHDTTAAVIRICNKIRLYAHRRNAGLGCDKRFLPAWLFCVHRSATAGKTALPLHAGDDGLIRNFDEARPSKARHGFCGFSARVWRGRPKLSVRTDVYGAYLAALHKGTPGDTTITPNKERGNKPRRNLTEQDTPQGAAPNGDRVPWTDVSVVGTDATPLPFRLTSVTRLDEDMRGTMQGAALGRQLVMSWPEPGPWC